MGMIRWLLLGALGLGPVLAGEFQIGPDAELDSLSLAAGASNYLVVWRDLRNPAAPQVRGATVSATGVVSPDFPISDAGGQPLEEPVQRQRVAFDGTNFLVVWADNRASGAGIRGALVTPQGAIAVADFLISEVSRSNDLAPQAIFSGAEFFVAWQDVAACSTAATDIYFRRVSSTGYVRQWVTGCALGVSLGSGQRQALEFLVPGPGGETLVVFQETGSTPVVSRCTRVAADYPFTGSTPTVSSLLFKRDFGPSGFGAPVGAAYDGGEYLILSCHNAQIDSSVFKTRLLANGTVIRPSAPFAEVGQGTTGLSEDVFPRAFYNGNREFLFLRNSKVSDTAWHLLSKRAQTDGTDRDPNTPVIDGASQGVLNGAAAAAIGAQYLVAWMDGRRSGAQPARQLNIYGLLVDGSRPGDESVPFLKAVARAAPIVGDSPLLVNFGTAGSTGVVDQILWEFGDGASATTSAASHTYTSKGEYIAVLSLIHAGFALRDFARIVVDGDELGGGGGPPQALGGSLGPVSNGVNTDVVPNTLFVTLNFKKPGNDSLRFTGFMDPAVLPVSVANKSGSFSIGGKTYEFTTAANGVFFTAAEKTPAMRFLVNRFTGGFDLLVVLDDLRSTMESFGALNETVAKPGREITVSFSFSYAGLKLESTLGCTYQAQAGKAGRGTYLFGNVGYPGSGFFHVFAASAAESEAGSGKVHTFTVTGNFGSGGKQGLRKADSGNWRVTLGNYVEDLPVGALTQNGEVYSFKGAKGKTGINQFIYNTRSGAFGIVWKNINAEGNSPSGMTLSNSTFSRADMALSLDLDTQSGTKFQASVYVRYGRKKLNSKKWKLR